jgi:PAS domain S-box-containing protein
MMKVAGNVDAHPSATSGFSPPGRGLVFRFGLSLLWVGASTGFAVLTWKFGITRGQASIFLFGIAIAAWYGGRGPAMVAVLLSTLAYDYFFIEPLYSLGINREDLPLLVLFLVFAILITRFTSVRRKVEAELQKSRNELEIKVLERTAELRTSEQRYRELIDASPDAIFVWDKDGKCVLANASAATLVGAPQEELVGMHFGQRQRAGEPELTRQRLAQARQGVVRFESEWVRKNNDVVPVEISLSTAPGNQYQGIVRDVSARKEAEEELRKQAELLGLAHDAIIVRDAQDRVIFWNRGAERTYGWTAAEAFGRITHDLLQTKFPVALEAIDATLRERGEWEGELPHITRDGRMIVVTSRQSLRRDEHGAAVAILEINRDITDRKHAEEEIRKLNQELEGRVIERTRELQVVNKELEAFAYSVSHDLRAPVRHIAGFTELLEKHSGQVLDEKSRHYTQMILDSANRMGALVDDLLAFSRIGRSETQRTTVDLDRLVKAVLGEIAPDVQGRKIAWNIGQLPICYGDPAMLRIVFGNLISNAVKFTRTREQAEIEIGSLNHTPGELVVFIKDNGVGFDMKYKDKLFGVFQRLHSQEAFEGTGIGLATVHRIVHRHGGRVWVEGAIDSGATFYVALPKLGKAKLDEKTDKQG